MTYIRRKLKHTATKTSNKPMVMVTAIVASSTVAPIVMTNTVSAASFQTNFIQTIGPTARQIAQENDLYASIMIAQAILESDWGRSGLSQNANNYFGVKGAYNGQSVVMRTAEQKKTGEIYYINEPFRKYPSIRESLLDYVAVLKGSQFYAGAWKQNTTSYQQATRHLTGRYATALNYDSVLNQLIAMYNLTQFDTPITKPVQSVQPVVNSIEATGTYTVVRGDSVWAIANKFNMTMAQVVALNHIQNYFIYPGQVLKVKATQTVTPTQPVQSVSTVSTAKQTTPVVSSETNSHRQTYTVVSGDSVWRIANKFGISMDQLRTINNIKNNFIYPGQVLTISSRNTVQANVSQTKTRDVTPTTQTTYTVVPGDSVWRIANKFGISMDQLRTLNHIQNNLIHPGQVLVIK